MSKYGITEQTLNWIESFFSNREQKVIVNGSSSTSEPVVSGVPQGSVLGSLLFIFYINDLVNCSKEKIKIRIFADDTAVYFACSNIADFKKQIKAICYELKALI